MHLAIILYFMILNLKQATNTSSVTFGDSFPSRGSLFVIRTRIVKRRTLLFYRST